MKKLLLIPAIAVCVIMAIVLGCNKEKIFDNDSLSLYNSLKDNEVAIADNSGSHFLANSRIGKLLLTYEATGENGLFVSSLKITDTDNDQKVTQTNFTLNVLLDGYKFQPYRNVISEAEKVKSDYTQAEIEGIARGYEFFARTILDKGVDSRSQLIQSLFFHNAVLNTVKRSLQQNEDCGCTPHPGYFVDKNPFFCQEDYFINPKSFIEAIDKSTYVMTEQDKKVYAYLQQHKNEPSISSDKLLSIMMPRKAFLNKVEKFRIGLNAPAQLKNGIMVKLAVPCDDPPAGSDLGCCGNYQGCCWYWSLFCLSHDVACLCCDHWYCLWGCKKESWCPPSS